MSPSTMDNFENWKEWVSGNGLLQHDALLREKLQRLRQNSIPCLLSQPRLTSAVKRFLAYPMQPGPDGLQKRIAPATRATNELKNY